MRWVCPQVQSPDELKKWGLYAQLQEKVKEFDFFALALDESNDVQDTAQLLIFLCGVSSNFEVYEELAALQSLKGTTTGDDIFGKVCQTMGELGLDWSKLASITTDGAPSMVGVSRGLIGRMNRDMEEICLSPPLQVHSLIHQQALCCKVLKWESVMKVVVSCINFIRANGLKHWQFQAFLAELESAHGDVLYHTEVRWLSHGQSLEAFLRATTRNPCLSSDKGQNCPRTDQLRMEMGPGLFNRCDRNVERP